jgi:hypothetical protein
VAGKDETHVSASSTTPSKNAHSWLEQLRTVVATLSPDPDVNRLLWGLSEAVEQILAEHSGMAEELLCAYEQLGIVFEATRKLPTVQRESQVVDLFTESLRQSFDGRAVFVADPAPEEGWFARGTDREIDSWTEGLLRRARENASVQVENAPPGLVPRTVIQVMIGPVFAGGDFVCAIVLARGHGVPEFRSSDMLLLEALTTFCGDLIRNHRLVRELREMCFTMVRSLVNAVDQKDAYTSGHSVRVGYYATLLGRRLNLEEKEIRMLQWSALLHDVGKIGVRDDVLKKKGKLTKEEYDHIKEHPIRSHRIVQGVLQLAGALDGVLHHHERQDGTGYPSRLAKENIPLQARIIQIADVFDALTSNRSYRTAYNWRESLAILQKEAGHSTDPNLGQVFDELMHELLDGDDENWARLVHRAEQFTEMTDDGLPDIPEPTK